MLKNAQNGDLKLFEYWSKFHQIKTFVLPSKLLETFVSTDFSKASSFRDSELQKRQFLLRISINQNHYCRYVWNFLFLSNPSLFSDLSVATIS